MKGENMHIFLAGGGDANDSKLLDEQFVTKLDLAKPLVYIPNAMQSRPYPVCLQWLQSVMTPLGVHTIEMWDDLRPHRPISDIAGVYIGGGNTTKLLKEVRNAGFDSYLADVVKADLPLYGGSAGAIILGEDIRSAPEAKNLNVSEAVGLGIVKRHSIVCHYDRKDEGDVVFTAKTLNQMIVAIPEKAGGYLVGDVLTNYGTEPISIFRKDGIVSVDPHSSVVLQ